MRELWQEKSDGFSCFFYLFKFLFYYGWCIASATGVGLYFEFKSTLAETWRMILVRSVDIFLSELLRIFAGRRR